MSPDLIRRFVGARAIETVPRMTETRAHRGLAVGTRDERGRGGYERGGGGLRKGRRNTPLSLYVAAGTTTVFCDEGWTDVTSRELTP